MRRELLFCAVVILCRLALTADIPQTRRDLRVDDGLYVRTADHLLRGEWQGPYDGYTLAKSIGYPAFLAGAGAAGIPARVAEELLLAAAALALWAALRALGLGPLTAGAAFVLALFSPANLSPSINRVSRESIYNAQVMLVFAGALALGAPLGPVRRAVTSTGLAIAVAWTWHTREESVWLIPPLLAALTGAVILRRRAAGTARSVTEVAVAAALVAAAIAGSTRWIAGMNEEHYGARTLVELADPDFEAAVGAIERVIPLRALPFGARTEDDFARLYDVSPALASLRSHIDGPAMRGDHMTVGGHRIHNFQTWVLRDAAIGAGHHATLPRAKAFYRRIADEINAACDRGELPCGPPRSRVVPLPRWSDRGAVWDALVEGGRALATGRIFPGGAGITMPVVEVKGAAAERFRRVLGEPAAPDMSRFFTQRILFHRIERVVRSIMPWLSSAGLLALAATLALRRRERLPPAASAAAVLLVGAGTRLAMLAALKAVYFPFAFNYLRPSHVLVSVAFICTAGDALARLAAARDLRAPRLVLAIGVTASLTIPAWLAWQEHRASRRAPSVARPEWSARVAGGGHRIVLVSPHYRFVPLGDRRLLAGHRDGAPVPPVRYVDAWVLTTRLGVPHDVVASGRVVRDSEPLDRADVVLTWEGRGEDAGPVGGTAQKTGPDGRFDFVLPARVTSAERIRLGVVDAPYAEIEIDRIDLIRSR